MDQEKLHHIHVYSINIILYRINHRRNPRDFYPLQKERSVADRNPVGSEDADKYILNNLLPQKLYHLGVFM